VGIVLFSGIGVALALAYMAALAWNARLYVLSAGGTAALLQLMRSVALLAALLALALAGMRPLLTALVAFACTHVALVSAAWRRA